MSRHLIVQKASAGSGKTFQLALNFIRMTLGDVDPDSGKRRLFYPDVRNRHREILAVTFTNKATEEMKQRIIKELKDLADINRPSAYRATLLDDFATDAETLAAAAASALCDMLFDYGNFHVSTIDAFFQTVLRSFAYEADLAGNYDLELDENSINEQAINDTIGAAVGFVKTAEARRLRGWIQRYISNLRAGAESFDLLNPDNSSRTEMMKFVKDLTDETFKAQKASIEEFADKTEDIATLHDALKAKLDRLSAEIVELARRIDITHLLRGNCKLANFLKLAVMGWPVDSNNYNRLYASADLACSFVKPDFPETEAVVRQLFDKIRLYMTALSIFSNIHNYGLFSEILKFAERLKVATNTIMLSDTNTLLNRIIGDAESPFIYERIGRRFRHFLIDEFQDTSRLQWENLRPLLLESLSEDNDNLIIGDVKQCIYRFRNSDPKLLDSELETDPRIAGHLDLQPHNTNYRSSDVIVNFNNELFSGLSRQLGFSSVYSTVCQTPNRHTPGYVSVSLPPEGEKNGLNLMIENIVRQLDPQQGNYSPGDIVVLVRYNSDAKKIVDFLLAQSAPGAPLEGVSILSDEALLVSSSPSVQGIVNTLRHSLDPIDDKDYSVFETSTAAMDRFDERLRQLAAQGLDSNQALETAINELRENALPVFADNQINRGISLFEMVEELIAGLPDETKSAEAIYLCAFQDMVLDYCRSMNPNIYDFLKFWDSKGSAEAIGLSGNVNAIRVMTIHKSKGLEFPCVHIPVMPEKICREEGFRWFDAEEAFDALELKCRTPRFFPIKSGSGLLRTLFSDQYQKLLSESRLDELNALYVAFTRAKNELCVTLNPKVVDPASKKSAEEREKAEEQARDNVSNLILNVLHGRLEFGEPTAAAPAESDGDEATSLISLDEYSTVSRRSPWDFTSVDVTSDISDEIF